MIKETTKKSFPASAGLGAAVFGAIVGGTAAAATSIRKVRDGSMTRQEATMDVAREAGTTGLAAGAGVAVTSVFGLGGLVSLLGVVAVATGTKYALDSALKPSMANVPAVTEDLAPKRMAKETPKPSTTKADKAPARKSAKAVKPVSDDKDNKIQ